MNKQEQFCIDMLKANFTVKQYYGRLFYKGWAVKCRREQLQNVIRATSVNLQWDDMGRGGLVIYPEQDI